MDTRSLMDDFADRAMDRAKESFLGIEKPPPVLPEMLVERFYAGRTLSSFLVYYMIEARVVVEDQEMAEAANLGKEENQHALLDRWHDKVFSEAFKDGDFFFAYGWSGELEDENALPFYQARSRTLQLREDEGKLGFWHDPNARHLTKACNQIDFKDSGCRVALMRLTTHFTPDTVEENIRNMDEERFKEALDDMRITVAAEHSALVGLRDLHEIRRSLLTSRTTVDRQGDNYSIHAFGEGPDIRLSWSLRSEVRVGSHRLLGFRSTGGLPPTEEVKFSKTSSNRTLVVDSRQDGSVTQRLEQGQTYYYSFFLEPINDTPLDKLRGGAKEPKGFDDVQFSVSVPEAEDPVESLNEKINIEKLQQRLNELQGSQKTEQDPMDRFYKDLDQAGMKVTMLEELEKARSRTKQQVEEKNYDAAMQKRLLNAVDTIFANTARRHY